MIDIALLCTDPARARCTARAKSSAVDVDQLSALDSELRIMQIRMEALRAEQKQLGKGADIDQACEPKISSNGATSRTVLAIPENTLNNGTVTVPEVLRPDPGGQDRIRKAAE